MDRIRSSHRGDPATSGRLGEQHSIQHELQVRDFFHIELKGQLDMAVKRKPSEKSFWSRMLSAHKVKRILEKRGFDPEAFRRDYETDTARGPRNAARPSEKDLNAVEGFLKTGDYSAYMQSLGTKSRPKADSVLRRVVAWKGQGGVKTVRRKASRDD